MGWIIHARDGGIAIIFIDGFAFDNVANLLARCGCRLGARSRLYLDELNIRSHLVEITKVLYRNSRHSFQRLPRIIIGTHDDDVGVAWRWIIQLIAHQALDHRLASI